MRKAWNSAEWFPIEEDRNDRFDDFGIEIHTTLFVFHSIIRYQSTVRDKLRNVQRENDQGVCVATKVSSGRAVPLNSVGTRDYSLL